jgi:lipopolysaccharide/colanic/teichoic acid biosynthesis glycosyltransferase
MAKRFFDIVFSLSALVFLFPFFILFAILIKLDSRGTVFYRQKRAGKNNCDFVLWKFRTMRQSDTNKSLITVGNDSRITRFGKFLRNYKLDELPQLYNIIKGEMSIVGPRPEVRKYVDMYSSNQLRVLSVRPGLTDYASVEYYNESEVLESYPDPEKAYTEIIMPAKLKLNLSYIDTKKPCQDLVIILKTIKRIISN